MTYDQQILDILLEVGERGISVGALAKHVYNQNCTFFFQPDFQEVRQYVQQYLLQGSKSAQSLIESTGKRGYYRLNTQGSADARQLMLHFQEESAAPSALNENEKPQQDFSLSLFGDDF
ncbi:MAG: hypothetical protein IJ841_02045 [Prevotella sp.]|nr:hypothetical protein [Prevotella sp.]